MHGGRVDPREPSGDDKKGKNVSTTNEVLVPVHSGTQHTGSEIFQRKVETKDSSVHQNLIFNFEVASIGRITAHRSSFR